MLELPGGIGKSRISHAIAILFALESKGKGIHIVTSRQGLSKRDEEVFSDLRKVASNCLKSGINYCSDLEQLRSKVKRTDLIIIDEAD